jgi:uncharacterized coiled-coil DUF342 family protein
LDLLEEKVRKAATLISTLREERAAAEKRLEERDREIDELRSRLGQGPGDEEMHELQRLRLERREVLSRVNRMLGLLDEAAAHSGEADLLAAVDEME